MSTPAQTPDVGVQYVKLPDGTYGKFRADQSDAEIHSILSQQFPKEMAKVGHNLPAPTAQIKAAPAPFSMPWLKEKFFNGADATASAMPAGGAMGGAIIGGSAGTLGAPGPGTVAGAIGGAGMGGMAGEAASQIFRRMIGLSGAPDTPQEAASRITQEGAIQGGIEAASAGLGRFVPFLRNSANEQYLKALAPTTKVNKAIAQDITPEMIDRGVVGSLKSIEGRAANEAAAIKPQLDAAYNATPRAATAGSGTQILGDLQKLKTKYIVAGKVANPEAVNAINSVQDIVQQYGPDISPSSLRQLKSIFDDPVAQQGGYAGTDLTSKYSLKAKSAAANSIRNLMSTANPDVAALNKEISFWLDVQRVAGASALRRTGQEGGLLKALSPLAGAAAAGTGLATGSAEKGALAATVATLSGLAYHAVRTPGWRTASAVLKDRFADAVASGSVPQAAALLGRLGVAAVESKRSPQQNDPQMPQ